MRTGATRRGGTAKNQLVMAWLGYDPWPCMAHSRFFEVWFGSTSEWPSWSTIISHHKPSLGPQCTTHQIALALGPVFCWGQPIVVAGKAGPKMFASNWARWLMLMVVWQCAPCSRAGATSNFDLGHPSEFTPRRPCSDNGLGYCSR